MIDWEMTRLGDIAQMCLGKMLDKEKNKGELQPYLANINVRWGSFDFTSLNQMRFESSEEERYGLREGDLIICEGGEPGRCALWKGEVEGMKIQKALHRVRVNANYSSEFIYYRFLLAGKNGELEKHFIGSTIKHLTGIGLRQVEFLLPPLNQQKKIKAVLSTLDAKIDLNHRINAELEGMAKLLYDYWFVQFDFPISAAQAAAMGNPRLAGKPYKSSGGKMTHAPELKREIPADWENGIAKNLFIFNPSISIKKGEVAAYLDMDALPIRGFMTKQVQRKEFNGGTKFRNGDLLVARIAPCLENGKTGLVTLLEDDEAAFGSTEFIVMRGRAIPLCGFGCCLSRSEYFRSFAVRNMTGTSGRKRLEAPVLEKLPLPIPPAETLAAFEQLISPMFRMMTEHTKQNQELTALRDWLLPLLMNGQVTVR